MEGKSLEAKVSLCAKPVYMIQLSTSLFRLVPEIDIHVQEEDQIQALTTTVAETFGTNVEFDTPGV